MANRAFTPPQAGLASVSEGLGLLQLAGGSVFIPTLLGAHILSDPGLRNLGHQENKSSGQPGGRRGVGGGVLRSWVTRTPFCISFAPRERVRQTLGGGREGVCYIFTNCTNLKGSPSCLAEQLGLLSVRLRGFSTSAEISARSHSPHPRSPLPCRIFLFLLSSFGC